jgi:hypothetical protein
MRGERENMLGAIGTAGPAPLARARDVPERWTFLFVMERMEEGFRILSRLPLPTRPKGYINSMPIYLYDQADLNSQLENYELERMARTRNRVRILLNPAEIGRMEEALYWPSAYLSGREFSHLAHAVNLGALSSTGRSNESSSRGGRSTCASCTACASSSANSSAAACRCGDCVNVQRHCALATDGLPDSLLAAYREGLGLTVVTLITNGDGARLVAAPADAPLESLTIQPD